MDDKIQTRFETPVTLTSQKTIDGTLMTEMASIVLPLHSKAIIEKFILNEETPNQPYEMEFPRDEQREYFFQADFTSATTNEIDTAGTNAFGVFKANPVENDKWDWNLKSNGRFTIDIQLKTRLSVYLRPKKGVGRPGRILSWDYQWFLVHDNGGIITRYSVGDRISGYTEDHDLWIEWSGSRNTFKDGLPYLDLVVGDKLYLYGRFSYDGDRNWSSDKIGTHMLKQIVKMEGRTESKPSTTEAYLIHEVGDRIVKSISDNKGYIKSNLLGRPDIGYSAMGQSAKMAVTGGYQIRNFSKEKRPVIVSLKDFIESLNAMRCIGAAYEMDSEGNYYYRIERFDYFYRDVEIMTITNSVRDYYEEMDLDFVFNEVEIGYNKYPEDEVTTLDEFNTKHSYITPIASYKKKLSQLSKFIASGYAIELTRRKKFADTEMDSWKYDEDNFVITLNQSGSDWVPEKDESFVSPITGVISPETSYNIRLSPKRMLQAWAKLLNTGLVFKKSFELVKNTFFSKNGDLTTQFNAGETSNIGDPDKLLTTEKADVMLGELDRFDRIFAPEKITFKAALSIEEITDIKRCLQNLDTTGRNYGYIRVRDNEGSYHAGYPISIQYNPVSEMTTLVLRKKYAILGDQFDCTAYSDWNFSQFEAATGLSPEIEQCKFNDFN
ncbi:hypothetical protein [Pedobacter zeae]|uniref:Uncharacterized protein n=1 Tax=Pedobacter zeae TaxID=1737356 RepID=A0A7W6P5E7_9SPHI|nr:hypothetical protein [Pedobacter zeae]MBB4107753.1 hypothetical protein [Pedobacter zeae]